MKEKEGLIERFARVSDLPSEPLPGFPLIEIVGDCRVLIENHCGVSEYGRTQICVKVKYGTICIVGSKMELARMSKHQLVIAGRIDSISLLRR